MTDQPKRGPGRPAKSQIIEMVEETMTDLRNSADTEVEAPLVSRGLREAAIRAEELRNQMRNDNFDASMHDEFYIDPRKIPEGWDYNWKRESIAGMTDQEHMIEMRGVGWEPVDARRHPEMMAIGYVGPVRRKGMILMERPSEITRIAMDRELATAREVVASKERALGMTPSGTFERDSRRTGVNKSYEPMNIPRS